MQGNTLICTSRKIKRNPEMYFAQAEGSHISYASVHKLPFLNYFLFNSEARLSHNTVLFLFHGKYSILLTVVSHLSLQ